MATPAEILQRNAQQAAAAKKGGGQAHEGGGLLTGADYEVSDDLPPESDMQREAGSWFYDKFTLKLCGKNLSAQMTRKILIAGGALLVVMLLITVGSVASASDDHDGPGISDRASALFSSHRPVLPVSMALQEDQVDDDDEWMVAFEADLVAALNHPTQGLRGLPPLPHSSLVVDANDVAVGSIEECDDADDCTAEIWALSQSENVPMSKVTVYFLLQHPQDLEHILFVLDYQFRDTTSPLKTGTYSQAIMALDIDFAQGIVEEDEVAQVGNGACNRRDAGRSNCGPDADCVDAEGGHNCICHMGFTKQAGTQRCVATATTSTNARASIQEAEDDSQTYVTTSVVETSTCAAAGRSNCEGLVTYKLELTLTSGATNIYALFGQSGHPLDLPAAWQMGTTKSGSSWSIPATPSPFGADVGGVNHALQQHAPDAAFDSWMTIGETEGTPGLLATIGIDWSCWQIADVSRCDDDNGLLHITDGAVFLMNPDTGPSSSVASRSCTSPPCPITIAQITTTRGRAGVSMASMGAQGRHGAVENWKENEIRWRYPGSSGSG